jgi:hypothetical protein
LQSIFSHTFLQENLQLSHSKPLADTSQFLGSFGVVLQVPESGADEDEEDGQEAGGSWEMGMRQKVESGKLKEEMKKAVARRWQKKFLVLSCQLKDLKE